jgi:hypothetical protein
MKKYWKRWLALTMLFLLVILAWLLWPDRRLAQAKSLRNELTGPNAKSLSPEQRRDKWQQYRKLSEKLTPAQRDQLSAESRKRRQQEMAKYFAMSPADKTRYLDERIKGMEKMRQQMQEKNAQNKSKGGAGSASNPGGGQRPGGGTAAGGTGQNGPRDRSVAGRDQGRQNRLDSTSPAERAMFTQFMKDLNARRSQLGLAPMGRGSGPPR